MLAPAYPEKVQSETRTAKVRLTQLYEPRGADAVFRLGVAGDCFAIVDYLDELGDAIIDAVRQANGGAVSYSAQTGNESIEIAWQIM